MYDKAVKTCKEWLQDNPEDIVIKEKLDKMEKTLMAETTKNQRCYIR